MLLSFCAVFVLSFCAVVCAVLVLCVMCFFACIATLALFALSLAQPFSIVLQHFFVLTMCLPCHSACWFLSLPCHCHCSAVALLCFCLVFCPLVFALSPCLLFLFVCIGHLLPLIVQHVKHHVANVLSLCLSFAVFLCISWCCQFAVFLRVLVLSDVVFLWCCPCPVLLCCRFFAVLVLCDLLLRPHCHIGLFVFLLHCPFVLSSNSCLLLQSACLATRVAHIFTALLFSLFSLLLCFAFA